MRFDDRVTGNLETYAKQAKVIHLEIDPAEINKNVECDVAVLGNIKETIPLLTSMVNKSSHKSWLEKFSFHYEIEYKKVIKTKLIQQRMG